MREDWIKDKLTTFCESIVGGGTPSTKIERYWNGDTPWISSADILGVKEIVPRKFVTEEGIDNSATNKVEKDTIIVVTRVGLGKLAIAPFSLCFSQDNQGVKFYDGLVEIKYALYYLSLAVHEFKFSGRGTTINGVTKKQLKDLQFKLAPLPEQRAIVAKIEQLFSELDNGIANLKAAKDKLEIYRQAVLKKAFEGELTKEWRVTNDINPVWDMMSLKDIGNWKGGGTPSKSKPEYWDNGTVLWVSPKDMKTEVIMSTIDRITEESIEYSSAKWIEKGAILIVVRSGIIRRKLPVAIAGQDLTVNQDLQTIKPDDAFTSEFVFWFLIANDRDIRENCAKDGTTVDNINVPVLKKYKIPVPDLEEQNQIVQEIETRLSVCDNILANIEEGLEKSEALRQSILKQAFEGKLLSEEELEACRKEPDWEPAQKLLERIKNEKLAEA